MHDQQRYQVALAQEAVRGEIATENTAQLDKWGVQDHDDLAWAMILLEEVGEAVGALLEHCPGPFDATPFSVLAAAKSVGAWAKRTLEENIPDRDNPGARHDLDHEIVQVAAVAVAWRECRRRAQ